VQVSWEGGGTAPAEEYTFLYGKENDNHELGTGFFVHSRIVSAIKRVEFVNDRMSYVILRGRWFLIIVLNVHAPTEDKIDVMKGLNDDRVKSEASSRQSLGPSHTQISEIPRSQNPICSIYLII
jgi:hypothetical protein